VPKWERLPGTGSGGKWSESDDQLADRLRVALAGFETTTARPVCLHFPLAWAFEATTVWTSPAPRAEVDALAKQLHAQRIAPVLKHLDGVKTLYAVPVGSMAGVPVELLTPNHTVSYVPSGTFLARAKDKAAPAGRRTLALGDPILVRPGTPPPGLGPLPTGGVLITQVIPESVAAKARLQAGDVLLKYNGVEVKDVNGLRAAITANEKAASVPVTVWRETADRPFVRDVAPGRLGVVIATDPAPVAIANRRKTEALLASLRGGDWRDLPGTRVETDSLRRMLGEHCTVLNDGDASEQRLDALRKSGELSKFRYLHFATHGEGNSVQAFESALILAQDKLPRDALPKAGEPYIDGQLSAAEVRDFWKLDAELVTLSACETAVGKPSSGDGSLGFAQAFLHAGSRSVCLSLWKVDDAATALLMDRFYANLLGKREGVTKPMGKAAALDEAKRWLRNLSGEEALALTAKLTKGVARGDRGKDEALNLVVPSDGPKSPPAKESKPFAHPKYWAAFVLIGDPN
jgi:CHAT domain-containing protein